MSSETVLSYGSGGRDSERGKLRGSFTTSRSQDDPSALPTPPPPPSTSPANSLHEAAREQNSSPEYSSSSAAAAGASDSGQSLATSGSHSRNDARSLKHSSSTPLVTSAGSLLSISPSRNSVSFYGANTAKNEQSSSSAAASATAAAAAAASASPPEKEKEKKRKEVSSSRVKKFHRHFSQVSKDEKLINYFSCALVSDILLQGHLYITDQHFAFYSNVFGYVTKVVIPTSSVTKISKEKTAKIIPNAVGVATADERHVFGSFISREAAFRLMCSVCPPLAPAEILPKITADVEYLEEMSIEDDSSCSISGNESPPQGADGAANTTSTATVTTTTNEESSSLLRRKGTADGKATLRNSDIPSNAKTPNTGGGTVGARASAPPAAHYDKSNHNNTGVGHQSNSTNSNYNNHTHNNNNNSMSSLPKLGLPTSLLTTPTTGAAASAASNLTMIITGTASSTSVSSTPSPSTSTTSSPTTVMNTPPPKTTTATTTTSEKQSLVASFKTLSKTALTRLKFPTEFHVVYVGMLLAIVLAIFSGFLLYRILDIEAKTSLYRSPVVNWGSVNDDDIFVEALRWQRELQSKSSEEVQTILNTNLEQIAKVRRSLETLSMLIHDRSFASAPTTTSSTSPAEAFHRDDSD